MSIIMSLSEKKPLSFPVYFALQNEKNIFFSNIYNVIPRLGVNFVPTDMSAWALFLPPSQKSRYLGTCVL